MKGILSVVILLATIMATTFAVYAVAPIVLEDGASVAVATVVSVDAKTRDVTLVGPEGDHVTFTAGPEVRNFDQIKRGDRIIASYFAGFALGIGPKGSGVKDRLDSMEVDRAKKGQKPGVMISKTIEAVGVVKAVNAKDRSVSIEGVKNTLVLQVSKDVDLSQIEVGGEVEAVYVEAYAVNFIPAPEVSATVTLESTSVALGVGVTWGHGVMTMHDGTVHKFKVNGLTAVDLGVSSISTKGEVFNLVEAKDLNGKYLGGTAGATFFSGGSTSVIKNQKNVIIQLKSTQKGLKLTLSPGGMKVQLVE